MKLRSADTDCGVKNLKGKGILEVLGIDGNRALKCNIEK
jgi:hypothetical protein